jgi:TonB family protein
VIGKDGRVKSLHAASGDMSTIPAAMDAVRQWTYRPTVINGEPVEVATEVDVVFTPPKQQQQQVSTVAPPAKDFSPPVALTKVEPEYSPEAHLAKFQGSVQVSLTVDEKGQPQDVKVLKPVGLGLDEKAVEAVRKWTFRPGMKNGKAVAVPANVEVQFKLR